MINFFSKYRFIFYLFNFILICLYLFPGSLLGCFLYNDCYLQPQLTKDFLVSTNHLCAFSLLTIISILTYKNSNIFNYLNIYLIFLSIILEILHLFIPIRSFSNFRNKVFSQLAHGRGRCPGDARVSASTATRRARASAARAALGPCRGARAMSRRSGHFAALGPCCCARAMLLRSGPRLWLLRCCFPLSCVLSAPVFLPWAT